MGHRILPAVLLGCALLALGGGAQAGLLIINADTSDPVPRAAWEAIVEQFEDEHPGIDVRFNVYDHESYKQSVRNWLTSAAPDVVFWYVGNRLRQFVDADLLEEVSDIFSGPVKARFRPAALDLVTIEGRQYGVPYTYYHWGIYYRRDLLEQAGIITPLRHWDELLHACDQLKASGIEPIAIGTRHLWPAAGWFDYINLRLNGFHFHMELTGGRVPFTDERIRAVFALWRQLMDGDCFVADHAGMSWQESQALLYQGSAAMMLIGHFISANFPAELRPVMDFFPFPEIAPGVGSYENAPMNSVHIPSRARNKEDARAFLAFVARADVQERINAALLQLPVNQEAKIVDDRFLGMGRDLVEGADALAQFFDRDTREDLATLAMKGFQEFMVRPERLDDILENIERARQRLYP
jgi:multiple sugar transport system substrate-binding protein